MFFRTKLIKGSPLVQLVESYRNTEGQPRQRVVASLGDAQLPEAEKPLIAKAVETHLRGVGELFADDLSEEAAGWVTRILQLVGRSKSAQPVNAHTVDGVLVDRVETENVVELGPELVALHAWEQLGLDPVLKQAGLSPSQLATAKLLVANRFVEPLSEWALIDWAGRTALPELLNLRITKTAKDRLYHTGDALFKHRKLIETHLRRREADLFNPQRSIVLYDVTNTHFEGLCAKNPKARHGKNKQMRNDCRQVAVGMAFDERGLALAHDVFEGNIGESKTLALMLDRLVLPRQGDEQGNEGEDEAKASSSSSEHRPVVILDAGFASKANIALLKERGYSYLINITRSSRTRFSEDFESGDFELVTGRDRAAPPVEVKTIDDPEEPGGFLVLCRSAQRRQKEEAMLSKAEARFLKDIGALRKRIGKEQLKDPAKIERAIGRLQKKHPRVARYYTLQHQAEAKTLRATRDEAKLGEATARCGEYILKTDQSLPAPQIWSLYMVLLQAEEGFSCLKGTLGLRPNFHQLERRVEAHIFISILAYHLLSWVRETLNERDDHRDWKTLRRVLSTHCLTTTALPLHNGSVLRIRKASKPDAEQELIYKRLRIEWKNAFPPTKSFATPTATL